MKTSSAAVEKPVKPDTGKHAFEQPIMLPNEPMMETARGEVKPFIARANNHTELASNIDNPPDCDNKPAEVPQQAAMAAKRIALLSWESLHSISVGGIAAHVTYLAAALERQGHEVHVFTRQGDETQQQYENIHGVHYHRVPFPGDSDFINYINNMCVAFVDAVFAEEDYMGAHFNIVHAHDWLTSNAMVWIKKRKQRKTILTMHSTEYGRSGNKLWPGQSARIRDHERHGTYCADRVISVSNALKNELMWLYQLPEWKVQAIHNGVNYQDFEGDSDPAIIKQRYDIAAHETMVLFSGRLTAQKGPDLLVEAIPQILAQQPELKFVFAGEGDMSEALQTRARELGIEQSVRFIGFQQADTLKQLYRACDCVCVPSRNEPFGIVILEAWSAGKPVVATVNGGPAEFVWHDVTGLKIHPQPDSIAWGISHLFADQQHARWMGSKGREAVEKCFSWDNIAEQTLRIYDSL